MWKWVPHTVVLLFPQSFYWGRYLLMSTSLCQGPRALASSLGPELLEVGLWVSPQQLSHSRFDCIRTCRWLLQTYLLPWSLSEEELGERLEPLIISTYLHTLWTDLEIR